MQRRWSRIFSLAMGLPLLLALLAACGAGTTTGSSPTTGNGTPTGSITIKIASDFPVSGGDASAGKPAENGAHFAVDEANRTNFLPGYTFSFSPKDDVGAGNTHDPTVGQKNVTDLIGDAEVVGMVGPLNSSVAVAEMPVANQAPLAIISPANTNDCLTQNTPAYECGGANSQISKLRPTGKVTYFRIATLDQYQGAALADYGYQTKGYKKVYIIDDTETYGVGLARNFETEWKKIGGTVLGHQSIKVTNSYESVLTQAAALKPDLIFFGGNDTTGGVPIRQQMPKISGLENTPFEVGDGTKTGNFSKNITPLAGAPVFGSVATVDPEAVPAAKTFLDQYTKAYGTPGAYTTGGYDSGRILLQAIKVAIQEKHVSPPKDSNDAAQAKVFRQAVIDAVQGISYDGVTGHHTFDANGDTTNRAISIYTLGDLNTGDGWKFITQVNIK